MKQDWGKLKLMHEVLCISLSWAVQWVCWFFVEGTIRSPSVIFKFARPNHMAYNTSPWILTGELGEYGEAFQVLWDFSEISNAICAGLVNLEKWYWKTKIQMPILSASVSSSARLEVPLCWWLSSPWSKCQVSICWRNMGCWAVKRCGQLLGNCGMCFLILMFQPLFLSES